MARRSLPLALSIALLSAGGLLLGTLLLRLEVGVSGSSDDPLWRLLVPALGIVAAFFGVAGVAMRRPHVTLVGVLFLFLAAWGTFFSHAPLFLFAAALFVLATRLGNELGSGERGALWAIGTMAGIAGLVLLAARFATGGLSMTSLYVDVGLPATMLLVGAVSWWPHPASAAKAHEEPVPVSA